MLLCRRVELTGTGRYAFAPDEERVRVAGATAVHSPHLLFSRQNLPSEKL